MSTRYQLIQGIDDLLAFLGQRMHDFSQLVRRNRNDLQRMQNHWRTFDCERWVEARKRYFVDVRLLHQRNNDATFVSIEDGRLDHDHVRNRIAICASIAMNVELRHLQRRMLVRKRAVLLAKGIPGNDRFL